MGRPEIVAELEPLFLPRSVAVIGATNNITKWGFSTFASIKNRFPGDIYPVNNREDGSVLGIRSYPNIKDVPGHVDLAVIVIPADKVASVMEDCVAKGVKAGVIISAGFAETGPEGKAMQDEVVSIAGKGNIRLVGPNCMGMWSAAADLPAFMFPLPIMDGPLALISQGGNVGGSLVIDAVTRGIGFRHYISCGCTADIQIEDYIEYMGHDDTVKVVMVYVEGLQDGHRFIEKVGKVTVKKPVVVVKPGRTQAAAKAISSHSGAFTGSDAIYDAAFKKAGILRVDTGVEMLDTAIGLISQPLPKGRNVIIATPGGSYGVMCADACASRALKVIDLPDKAMETLNEMFPPRWSHGNPVDPAGDRNFIMYMKAPEVLLPFEEVDALIFMGFGSFSGVSAMLASAGGEMSKNMQRRIDNMKGLADISRSFVEILDSGDAERIKEIVKMGLRIIFGQVMSTKSSELDEFATNVAEALTTPKMIKSSFFTGLRQFFESAANGDIDHLKMAGIMELMEPMLDALIDRWINKFGKPIITTTFTEESTKIGEGGYFPYPSVERAANVLQKLVEYAEYLDHMEVEIAGKR